MTYSDIRSRARENLAGNWGVSIGTGLVAAIVSGSIAGSNWNFNFNAEQLQDLPPVILGYLAAWATIAGILSLVQMIAGGAAQLGYARFLLNQHDRSQLSFNDLFSQFYRFGQGFAQKLLRGVYVFLWALLLIVPGFIKGLAYSMTPFVMADYPQMRARDAIRYSENLMKGHKMDLFLLDLSFIGWDLLACLSLGIGFLWLNPYRNAAYAAFYREISSQSRIVE